MNEDNIVVSAQHAYTEPESFWKRMFTNKKLLAIVAVILVLELVWAGYTLTQPVPPPTFKDEALSSAATVNTNAALLSFDGPNTVSVGQSFPVNVMLDLPSVGSDAADVIINYDPLKLEVVTEGDKAAKEGTQFPSYPVNSVDPVSGQIVLAGAAEPGSLSPRGPGLFATVTFRAKATGRTDLSFEFTKGLATDSNVVDSKLGRDILESVSNYQLTINN